MSLPENVRVDWGTLGDLSEPELTAFLENAYKELRIGSTQANALVSIESIQAILKLANNDEMADSVADVVKCAWAHLSVDDQLFMLSRFCETINDDADAVAGLKINLIGQMQHEKAKAALMETITLGSVGVKTIAHLTKYAISRDDLDKMASGVNDSLIMLRIVEVASSGSIEAQQWGSTTLSRLIETTKEDPLMLINVFELMSGLDVTVIHESIGLLHQCLFDPIVQMMDTAKCSLMKIFTNYYAKTELALPDWYFEQLFGECPDAPGSFALQSLLFLAKTRPALVDVMRLKTSLVTMINKYYTSHDYELVIADLLTVLVSPDIDDDAFDYWFPEHGAKHYFVMSNDPSLDKREKGLNVILACAQFEQSIAHFHRIEEFPGLLEGSGCSSLRINIAQKLSSFNAFETAFGERLASKWQSAQAGKPIEVYDPNVATMEM